MSTETALIMYVLLRSFVNFATTVRPLIALTHALWPASNGKLYIPVTALIGTHDTLTCTCTCMHMCSTRHLHVHEHEHEHVHVHVHEHVHVHAEAA